ncbi:PREDICTED: alanine--glyoxylate aminotransferase 2, mitochondrial [Thamnophis sirtalis]|uniref:Alanine--glyoxylate aminotransferase 2, mitochondrial n=1 Tax=Thamnophis sirtalis TaxID=35019 RepID=A0A6I9XZG3_9SAUR|nr:PREDICTED: alanine--glyoxylate aminotransferase 2, mitochondrial [Thamnophis sirtalis]
MVGSARLPLARLPRFLAWKRAGTARALPGREVHQYQELKNSSCLQPKMPPCAFVPEKYDSYPYEQMLKIRQENVFPSLYTCYKRPLLIHQGYMQWLFDFEGRRYLDLFGGIVTVSVGHCHPKVTAAAQKQLGRLGHTSNIYLHPGIQEYAKKLTSLLPGSLKVAYLTNSGTEANDLAMLIARIFTRNTDVICLRGGYHGGSTYVMGITAIGRYKHSVANGANCHSVSILLCFLGGRRVFGTCWTYS